MLTVNISICRIQIRAIVQGTDPDSVSVYINDRIRIWFIQGSDPDLGSVYLDGLTRIWFLSRVGSGFGSSLP